MTTSTLKELWPELAGFAKKQTARKKEEIFRQGDAPKAVYFISRGLVKLSHVSFDGREITINLRHSGEMFGVATAIAQTEYDLSAAALTEGELQSIPVDDFIEAVKTDRQLSWRVHQTTCRNLISLNARLARIAQLSARQHLEHLLRHFLLEQYRGQAGDIPSAGAQLSLPISDKEIAKCLMISPQHLCDLFKELIEEGVVQREGERKLLVAAPGRLWHDDDVEAHRIVTSRGAQLNGIVHSQFQRHTPHQARH